ncbi:recombination protein NinB [Achromobacter xylosoxidans]|uniref:recombination protein NinB n=1 Tax=Alcaligenes xylosoxydans xylosoxydans TaxID=85698 RepID=UPI002ACA7B7B|nr:recombination protein NinB [Achromobacter xylosoxidans]MDZ5615025.1 recombination protein NinB [Achromobacter xylosoxidans]MDZ5625771.1 recombination protein NinB [Achromobacter xylosoxidans]MDZ5685338.1 recombination protein NinB [Achromobacter xylosoxidans]
MDKQVFVLSHPLARRNAAQACASAPDGYRVEIKPKTRTTAQNDMMWSILTDISRQVQFVVNGALVNIEPEEVKDVLTAGLRQEMRMAMGLNGGVVMLGQRTSRMSVRDMTQLIELAYAFGNEKGVEWSRTSLGRDA